MKKDLYKYNGAVGDFIWVFVPPPLLGHDASMDYNVHIWPIDFKQNIFITIDLNRHLFYSIDLQKLVRINKIQSLKLL